MSSSAARIATSVVALVALAVVVAGCGRSSSPGASAAGSKGSNHATFDVVAAENFWGSIAAQLAGDRATVQSIIVNPDTDPHSYEPTAQDARTIAGATLAIANGIGYDNWMTQVLGASPASGRIVLDVGDLLGLKEGDNAHQWYSPTSVYKVIDAIVADYDRLDPADSAYFAQQKRTLETQGFARYNQLRQEIRAKYEGVPVGYSESIFQPLGEDLGLKLLTPSSFAEAIAEGTDVTAHDKQTVDGQAQNREIEVWVYNSQNVTPDVQRITSLVKARHIPVATVTETLSPASDSFQQWQVSELEGLAAALRQATGR
ncbi:MAG: zinc/manganese transport system substrate-binding protein [Solirubrobacteraceae bacterium]|nr:zinc/manganese transport system substrate-binding protein [Solirubrobacteraceae bacterium]